MFREMIQFSNNEVIEYLRKSRSDDPLMSVGEVLEKHEKLLMEYSERNLGGKIPEKNIYREIASSETIDGRPEMLKLLKDIESPQIKAVLVVEVQRLSRGDLEDAGRLIKLLRYTGTFVLTPYKVYDLTDDYDRDAFERELKRGNEYLEYFKKIQSRGRLLSVQEGNYLGSVPPYGYNKIFITEGKKKCPTLEEKKSEADIVRMIFRLYADENMSRDSICRYLDDLKIKPPKGDYWSSATLKDMLSNVHYIGKVKWNWRKVERIVSDQEVIKTRPKSKNHLVFEGKHKGIVSTSLFMKAQERTGKVHRAKANTKVRNPLAGLLYCKCGRSMSFRTYKNTDGTLRSEPRLLCDGQIHCNTGSVKYDEMMERICDVLTSCISEFEILIEKDSGENIILHEKLVKELAVKLKELEDKEVRQWEMYTERAMPKSVFDRLNEKLLKEKNETRKSLRKAYDTMPKKENYQEKIIKFSDSLAALKNPEVSAELKNNYLKSIIERIDYTRESPVRITKKNCLSYGIDPKDLKSGGNWYSPPFHIDIKLRL